MSKGNYEIQLSFYAGNKWHHKTLTRNTLKGAYVLARIIQHNYSGTLYWFVLIDRERCKVRWQYDCETADCKWYNRQMLQQDKFGAIFGYKSIMQGA